MTFKKTAPTVGEGFWGGLSKNFEGHGWPERSAHGCARSGFWKAHPKSLLAQKRRIIAQSQMRNTETTVVDVLAPRYNVQSIFASAPHHPGATHTKLRETHGQKAVHQNPRLPNERVRLCPYGRPAQNGRSGGSHRQRR